MVRGRRKETPVRRETREDKDDDRKKSGNKGDHVREWAQFRAACVGNFFGSHFHFLSRVTWPCRNNNNIT